jgi:alanyl-tRNA synthetase
LQIAEELARTESNKLKQISVQFNNPKNITETIEKLIEEKNNLEKEIEKFQKEKTIQIKKTLLNSINKIDNINFIEANIEIDNANALKDLAFQLKGEIDNLVLIIGANVKGNPQLLVMISDNLVAEKDLDAGKIVRESAKEIKGGGGGQKFFATAGGKDINGLENAIEKAKSLVF